MAVVEAVIENRALPSYTYAPGMDAYTAAASASVPLGPSASRWGGGTVAQAPAEPTLRQMVELYAEQNDLDFLPKAGRREQGLQVRSTEEQSLAHHLQGNIQVTYSLRLICKTDSVILAFCARSNESSCSRNEGLMHCYLLKVVAA